LLEHEHARMLARERVICYHGQNLIWNHPNTEGSTMLSVYGFFTVARW
jgi:hypothetical protein